MFFYNINLIILLVVVLFFNNLIKYLNSLVILNYSNFYKNIFIISILSIIIITTVILYNSSMI